MMIMIMIISMNSKLAVR